MQAKRKRERSIVQAKRKGERSIVQAKRGERGRRKRKRKKKRKRRGGKEEEGKVDTAASSFVGFAECSSGASLV